MGEIAEMMLDGFLCQGCGEVIGDYESGEGLGYPGFCAGCQPDDRLACASTTTKAERKRERNATMEARCCLFCGKKLRTELAVMDHMRDRHAATVSWSRTAKP